jgi:hypothetical protein
VAYRIVLSSIAFVRLRIMRCLGHVARRGKKINAYSLSVGKPEGRWTLGRRRRGWMDNIRMDLVEVGWGDVYWIRLTLDRDRLRDLVNSVFNLRVRYNAGKLSSVLTIRDLSNSAYLHRIS